MSEVKTLHTEYISRINKTFDYIESNLEKSMTLEELANVANFSKFHFNRIFHSMVGETPFHFILRLRNLCSGETNLGKSGELAVTQVLFFL